MADIVSVKNLVKRYGELVALDHFDLRIAQGEIFGLLGPNGSGKTTSINCMLQLLPYDKGSVRLFGQDMAPDRYDLKRRIGVVPQQVAVFEELTVRENIDYFCSLYEPDRRPPPRAGGRGRGVRGPAGLLPLPPAASSPAAWPGA